MTAEGGKKCRSSAVLVTGATGYIGSHTVLELLNAGHRVVAVGNQSAGKTEEGVCVLPQCLMRVIILANCRGSMLTFRRCNLQNVDEVEKIFKTEEFSAVIHLASSKGVAPSIAAPMQYYTNNLVSSINLLKMCEKYGKKKVIFMSSATVYGVPKEMPVTERSATGGDITNPYGWAKHMIEQMLRDICRSAKDWRVVILRAFDPAGAHPSGLLGEDINAAGPKHLMPLIASVALGKMAAIRVCGNTFPTRDGSGSRDFVHVVDVARAIVLSLERMEAATAKWGDGNGGDENKENANNDNNNEKDEEDCAKNIEVYNLGLGSAQTVLEMVANYERACGEKIATIIGPARPGDVASIYCDITLAQRQLGWTPKYGVAHICEHLHKWYARCPNGYD